MQQKEHRSLNWRTYLIHWFNKKRISWLQRGIEATVTLPAINSDSNSVRIDFDSRDSIGRITVWESGECDLEILLVSSEETILWKHHQFSDVIVADEILRDFVALLDQSGGIGVKPEIG